MADDGSWITAAEEMSNFWLGSPPYTGPEEITRADRQVAAVSFRVSSSSLDPKFKDVVTSRYSPGDSALRQRWRVCEFTSFVVLEN